jgi:polyisoprenoid-binding protein YceI
MKHAILLAAAFAAAPLAALAEATLEPDAIPAGTYVIDSKETQLRYATTHMGFTQFWGVFPDASGTLTIDPKNLAATKLSVKAPVSHLETTNRELNGELLSDEFFSEAKFGSIRFVSTSVARTGPRTAKVAGDLTIRGVTKPVVLDVTFNGAGPNAFSKVTTLGFSAHTMVKRSDFGLGKYTPIVSDETEISISAAFELKPAG